MIKRNADLDIDRISEQTLDAAAPRPARLHGLLFCAAAALAVGFGGFALAQQGSFSFVTAAFAAENPARNASASGDMPLPMPLGDGKAVSGASGGPAIVPPDARDPMTTVNGTPEAATPAADQDPGDPLAWTDKKPATPASNPAAAAVPAPAGSASISAPAGAPSMPAFAGVPSMPAAPASPIVAPAQPLPVLPAPAVPVQKQDAEMPAFPSPAGANVKPVSAAADSAVESRIAALEKQEGEIQKSQRAEIAGLKETVDSLRREVVQLKEAQANQRETGRRESGARAADKNPAAEAPVARAHVARKKKAADAVLSGGHHGRKAKSAAGGQKWVLKSAKPGMAWLAMSGSAELYTFSVGEELPGLGKIGAIAQDTSGRWVVSAAHGKISQ